MHSCSNTFWQLSLLALVSFMYVIASTACSSCLLFSLREKLYASNSYLQQAKVLIDAFDMHVLSVFKLSWLVCDLLSKAFCVCLCYVCVHIHMHKDVLQRSADWYSWGLAQVIHWMLPHFTGLSLRGFHTIHQPDGRSLKQATVSISVNKSVFLIDFIFRVLPLS